MKFYYCAIILCTVYSKAHMYYGYNYGLYGYPGACCCRSFWYCAVKGNNSNTITESNCKDSGGYRCCVTEKGTLKCSLINSIPTTPKAQRYNLPTIAPNTVANYEKVPKHCKDKGEYRCCIVSNILKCKKLFNIPLTTESSVQPVNSHIFNTTITLTIIKPPKQIVEAEIVIDSDKGENDVLPAFKGKDERVIITKPESERTSTVISVKQHEISTSILDVYVEPTAIPRVPIINTSTIKTHPTTSSSPIETFSTHIEERKSSEMEYTTTSKSDIDASTHTEQTYVVQDTTLPIDTRLNMSTLYSHIEETTVIPSDIIISTESSKEPQVSETKDIEIESKTTQSSSTDFTDEYSGSGDIEIYDDSNLYVRGSGLISDDEDLEFFNNIDALK